MFFLGEAPAMKRANTVENIGELGKDVPIEIAIKRVMVSAQRSDWNGCEQALRSHSHTLESGINVPTGINVPLGKFGQINKHTHWNKRTPWKFDMNMN